MNVAQETIKSILIGFICETYLPQIEHLFDRLHECYDDLLRYEVSRQVAFTFDYENLPDLSYMTRDQLLMWGGFYRDHEAILYYGLKCYAMDDELYDMCDDVGIEEIGDDAKYMACYEAAESLWSSLDEMQCDEYYFFTKHMDTDLFLDNRVPVPDIGRDLAEFFDRA